jgi:hypothetical protein
MFEFVHEMSDLIVEVLVVDVESDSVLVDRVLEGSVRRMSLSYS